MKQFAIFAIVALALVANLAAAAVLKDLVVTFGGGSKARGLLHDEVDDSTTIRQLAEKTLKTWHMEADMDDIRMESHFGMTYKMDDTLQQAGVKDNTRIKLKAWSRLTDAAFVAAGGRIFAQDKLNDYPEALNGKKTKAWPEGLAQD